METKRTAVEIKNLMAYLGEEVIVKGFVESIRDHKKVIFMILRDADAKVQVIIWKNTTDEVLLEQVKKITTESTIKVCGKLTSNPFVKLGACEIIPSKIEVLSLANSPLPIDNTASLQDRLNWRFLDLRKPENLLIFKIQTALEHSMRETFMAEDFIEIHSPKLIGAASESGAELFSVKYFDTIAYLAQSPQFYKQMAMAAGFQKVFEIGPVFRANPSFTSRHDTEFTSVDFEFSWIESHEEVMAFEERWIQKMMIDAKNKFGDEIQNTFGVEIQIPTLPFPRIHMRDALKIVAETGYVAPKEYEGELDPEGEKIVFDYVKNTFNHEFMFVTGYPKKIRAFYHMLEDNGETTKSFDLLYKGMEITTGAQREHRVEILEKQAEAKGISLKSIDFYLDFFRYGVPPHGGLGFGLTRFLMLLIGLRNVREVTYVYRGPNRLRP